jgi:predicted NBD/HSP70 family sugar kinase
VIGIDVGGTKTRAGAVEILRSRGSDRIIVSEQIATPRAGPSAFYDALAALVRSVGDRARAQGAELLPIVALAQPGRFLPDGRLARGTTPNLGTAPEQFDGIAPARELERRLGGRVIAENDAVAQMRFGLDLLLRDADIRPRLLGETVVYLGPGTGMGGGVATVSRSGEVGVVTDGHLFDVQVAGVGDGTRIAEELFTGPAIARRVAQANRRLSTPIDPPRGGRLDELLAEPGAPADHRAAALEVAGDFGEVLAALIQTLHAGRIVKVRLEPKPDGSMLRHVNEPDRAWSTEDQAVVRGIRRIILGGFIGCSRFLGAEIRHRALEALRAQGLPEVEILQIPSDSADAGLLGIVRAIPHRI